MRITKTGFPQGPAVLLLCALTSHTVSADEYAHTALSESDFYAVIPEVVSATRMTQKLTEAPASISIIDRDMIRASGAIYITDLLRLVPGFQAFHVNSNKFGATYHGVSDDFPHRLEVMLDGRSIHQPLLSTVDWNSIGISLDDIERIEVVRGSNVPAYGSNAFLGAINIVTRTPYSETGSSLKVLGGSMDTRRVEGRFSTPLGSSQLRVTAGHDQNDGSNSFQDGARNQYFNLSSSLVPTFADTVLLQAGVTDGFADRADMDRSYKPVVQRDHQSNYQYLRWNHISDAANEFQLSAYHNDFQMSMPKATVADLVKYEGLPAGIAALLLQHNPEFRLDNEHGKAELYDIELQHTHQLIPDRATLLWGLGYRNESASSEVLLQDRGRIDEDRWRLFGNLELVPADAVTLNFGAMAESSSTSDSGVRLSPRAALNFRPDDHSVIRAAYSQAYRMPSLFEKNAQYSIDLISVIDEIATPNPLLDPERIRTTEVGYFRAFSSMNGHFDLRLFVEDVEQAIGGYRVNRSDDDKYVELNANNTSWQNNGAEFQLRLQPVDRFWLLLNYSYTNTTDHVRDRGPAHDRGPQIDRSILSQTPLHTASMLLNYRLPQRWDLSVGQYYVDDVDWDEGGYRDSYNRTDLRLGKEWPLSSGQRLAGALVLQNFLGDEYSEFYQYNEFDQRTYLQLTLEF